MLSSDSNGAHPHRFTLEHIAGLANHAVRDAVQMLHDYAGEEKGARLMNEAERAFVATAVGAAQQTMPEETANGNPQGHTYFSFLQDKLARGREKNQNHFPSNLLRSFLTHQETPQTQACKPLMASLEAMLAEKHKNGFHAPLEIDAAIRTLVDYLAENNVTLPRTLEAKRSHPIAR